MTILANLKYYSTHIKNTQKIHTYKEVEKKAMLIFSFRWKKNILNLTE